MSTSPWVQPQIPAASALVLGGSGFIGSHLISTLANQGWRVKSFDRTPSPILSDFLNLSNITQCIGDFFSFDDLSAIVQPGDVIFHLVSNTTPQKSNGDPYCDAYDNLLGTIRLLDIAVAQKARKVIFISSGGTVYGIPKQIPISEDHATDPICAYGVAKLAAEKYMSLYKHLHGLETCILRLANPYGPMQNPASGQGLVAKVLASIIQEEEIQIWGDGSVVRDYVYVGDAIEAIVRAAAHPCFSGPCNIGSGIGHSIVDMISIITELTGRKAKLSFLPPRQCDVPANVLAIDKAERELGWKPRTRLEDGLRATINSILTDAISSFHS